MKRSLIGVRVSLKVTKLRSLPIIPFYPKQVWDYLKQEYFFPVSFSCVWVFIVPLIDPPFKQKECDFFISFILKQACPV